MIILFIVILGMMLRMSSTDSFYSAFPQMVDFYKTTENYIQSSLSINLIGTLCSVGVIGIMSDYYGRRPIMLGGIFVFMLGSLMCWFFPNIYFYLLGRFLQGVGVSSVGVIGYAAISDVFEDKQRVRVMGVLSIIIPLSSMSSVFLGGYLTQNYSWFMLFKIIGTFSIVYFVLIYTCFLETNKYIKQNINFSNIIKDYIIVFTNKNILFYLSCFPFLLSSWWALITIASFYFVGVLGLSPIYFSKLTILYLGSMSIGGLIGIILSIWLSVDAIMKTGILLSLISSVFLILVNTYYIDDILLLSLFLCCYSIAIGLISAPSYAKAFTFFPKHKGVVSSLRGLCFVIYSLIGTFVGTVLPSNSLSRVFVYFLFVSVISIVGFFLLHRKNQVVS